MKRHVMINALLSVGHNKRTLERKSNDSLKKLLNLANKKIQALREEKARKEAELSARMKERSEQQKEEARIEKIRLGRLILRAAREAKGQEAIRRFQSEGFKPLVRFGAAEPSFRQRLAELDAKIEETKAALRSNRWTEQLSKAAALAVLERNCFVDEQPEEIQRKIRVEDYLRKTERPLFGAAK
jgi:hypothetical protein